MRLERLEMAIIVVSAVALAYVGKPFTRFSFEPVRRELLRFFRQIAA